jgi:1,4-alpha-glucan branching enzyme
MTSSWSRLFSEATWTCYRLGFPAGGFWEERFNRDVYDHWVNPQVACNGGGVVAEGRALHEFTASAEIVIPANSVVVFVKE